MTILEVFADVTCPFTHVGLRRVVDDVGDIVQLRVRAWPLEWVNGAPMEAGAVSAKTEALRDQLHVDAFSGLRPERWPATTIPALNLAAAAYERGPDLGLVASMAIRDALFERGLDISDTDVLAELATRFDLPIPGAEACRSVLDDFADGRRRGVRGSPDFFVHGREFFCPALDLGHDDDGDLVARFDRDGFDRFIATVRAESTGAD